MRRLSLLAWAVLAAVPPLAAAQADEFVHLHVVERGDTLIGLGRRLLIDPGQWVELQRVNGVRNPRRIPVGTRLRVPLRLMHADPGLATVASVTGPVRGPGGAAVQPGQSLAEGDELDTGRDGQVSVRLVDGTLLRLRSTSRLRIDEARRMRLGGATRSGVQLDSGRVEVEAQPAAGGRPGFRIRTPQGVMGVRGTEFRVVAEDQVTRGEVLEGAVAVAAAAGSAETRVNAGYGTVVDAGGRVLPPLPLLPAPDLSALAGLHERPLLRLAVPPLAGAQSYRVQVALDGKFDQLVAEVTSPGAELRIPGLPDGRYQVRVRGVDANGLEGRDSAVSLRLKARPEPPLPGAPQPRAVIMGERVEFSWTASVDAASYRIQVATAGGLASPLHDLAGLTVTRHALDRVAPGSYQWRVASVRPDGDQGPFNDPLSFEVRALPPTPGPPQPPDVGDQGVRLFWSGLPGQTFDVQLARDRAFTQIVLERQVATTELELPLPGTGRFFVRLRARDADGFVGAFSTAQSFEVPLCVRHSGGGCVRVGPEPLLMQQ